MRGDDGVQRHEGRIGGTGVADPGEVPSGVERHGSILEPRPPLRSSTSDQRCDPSNCGGADNQDNAPHDHTDVRAGSRRRHRPVRPQPRRRVRGHPRTQVPLLSNYKSCDFIQQDFVDATGYARGTAYLSTSGNTVSADVDFNTAVPDSFYDVRIIQTPRGSMGCGPGAPGVVTGILRTDPGGSGRTTVSGPIDANATGAW